MVFAPIHAVVFDMDGTLIDSECHTEQCVQDVLTQLGHADVNVDCTPFYGTTWRSVEQRLYVLYPSLLGQPVARLLSKRFEELGRAHVPAFLPGAIDALEKISRVVPVAIATSSHQPSVDALLSRLPTSVTISAVACADNCTAYKPDPQPFLNAARALGQDPQRCVAFEDSVAGLTAAKAAGMWTIAVTHTSKHKTQIQEMAHQSIGHYNDLSVAFFATLIPVERT